MAFLKNFEINFERFLARKCNSIKKADKMSAFFVTLPTIRNRFVFPKQAYRRHFVAK